MAKKKPAEKIHGNKKILSEKLIYGLAKKWCTNEEIADLCECSADTIERNYLHLIKKARAEGKEALRTAQWRSAIDNDNVTMQIWLGKQKLGQKEPAKEEVEQQGTSFALTINPKAVPHDSES